MRFCLPRGQNPDEVRINLLSQQVSLAQTRIRRGQVREREREREWHHAFLIDRNPHKHMQTNSVNRRNSESESESEAENTMYRTYCKKEAAGNGRRFSSPRCQALAV